MRHRLALAVLMLPWGPALAQDLPQGPKLGPPPPLPEAPCDTERADRGDWLEGVWLSPGARWEIRRTAAGLVWRVERGSDSDSGPVGPVSACSVVLRGAGGAVVLDGVRSGSGAVLAHTPAPDGPGGHWLLRRQP
jgi:hypothetical protein